jgi:transporter family-2 protein
MYSTILAFIGQLAMGIFLDLLIGNSFSSGRILGLVLISIGFLYNMDIDR